MSNGWQLIVILAPVALLIVGLLIACSEKAVYPALQKNTRSMQSNIRRGRVLSRVGATLFWIGVVGLIPAAYFAGSGTPGH